MAKCRYFWSAYSSISWSYVPCRLFMGAKKMNWMVFISSVRWSKVRKLCYICGFLPFVFQINGRVHNTAQRHHGPWGSLLWTKFTYVCMQLIWWEYVRRCHIKYVRNDWNVMMQTETSRLNEHILWVIKLLKNKVSKSLQLKLYSFFPSFLNFILNCCHFHLIDSNMKRWK